jgi:hypothetical protein
VGRIEFTPSPERHSYAFRIPATLSRFFNGLVYPQGMASPTGNERLWGEWGLHRLVRLFSMTTRRNLGAAARTRHQEPCEARAITGKNRCRMHGGLSTGPRTRGSSTSETPPLSRGDASPVDRRLRRHAGVTPDPHPDSGLRDPLVRRYGRSAGRRPRHCARTRGIPQHEVETPARNRSIASAAPQPSLTAVTNGPMPRVMLPPANTPRCEVMWLASTT